jgi:hypothetical protein
MTLRRIGLAIGLATLVVSGYYVLAYLYWWEWNRALIAGVFFLATEIAIGALLVMQRIGRLERQIELQGRSGHHRQTLATLRDSAPRPRSTFAWLDPTRSSSLNVFVPILLGAGVLLSGLAWLVERVVRALGNPSLERDLAARLDDIGPPVSFLEPPSDRPPLRPYLR